MTRWDLPTTDPSLWFSFQHFPSIINQTGWQTTLAVWDNGDSRVLDAAPGREVARQAVPKQIGNHGTFLNLENGGSRIAQQRYNLRLRVFLRCVHIGSAGHPGVADESGIQRKLDADQLQ